MADDLLIGGVSGTSLSGLGRIVQDFGPALSGAPTIRNEADVVPRRFGSVQTDSITGSLIVPVKMLLLGKKSNGAYTRAQYHDAARTLGTLVFNRGKAFMLGRVVDSESGAVSCETQARYLRGLESPEQVAAHGGRVAFDLEVFAGCFYLPADTTINPGVNIINGELDTRRIVITVASAGTLTNTTLGVSVTVTAGCTLNVEAFTATAGIAGLSWSGDDYWFVLAPGSNTITWTGTGTPAIAYRAAFL